MTDRVADTRVPVNAAIAGRWSPRAFDPSAVVSPEQITAVLEAARWAATWGRRQPVRFIVGMRGDETFERLSALLKRGNSYAKMAGALILVCVDDGPDDHTALYAAVDAGAAIAQMSLEAVSRGLIAHPMAGFNKEAARPEFGLPDEARPIAIVAMGSLGDYAAVDEAIVERDSMPRQRLPLEDIAFSGTWGRSFRSFQPTVGPQGRT